MSLYDFSLDRALYIIDLIFRNALIVIFFIFLIWLIAAIWNNRTIPEIRLEKIFLPVRKRLKRKIRETTVMRDIALLRKGGIRCDLLADRDLIQILRSHAVAEQKFKTSEHKTPR